MKVIDIYTASLTVLRLELKTTNLYAREVRRLIKKREKQAMTLPSLKGNG